MSDDIEITTKVVNTSKGAETRYFANSKDGFDGTAQGYGYKSKHKLYKAYYFHKNKSKYKQRDSELKSFLKEHPDVKKLLRAYLGAQETLYRCKDGEETSFKNLLTCIEDDDMKSKITSIKHLWKTILNSREL